MPNWGYSVYKLDTERTAKASGRDLRVSPKAAREICKAIKGMNLDKARQFLLNVVNKKNCVPYRRYKKKVPHKTGIIGWYAGRYPIKAATEVLKIIDNLEANADDKGLNFEKLQIIHAATHKSRKIKGYIPRAFGRSSPRHKQLSHIELVIKEME